MSQLNLLKACSQKIRKEALQLIGSTEANIEFGTGAGGDTIKKIDLAAENAIMRARTQLNATKAPFKTRRKSNHLS